MRLVIFIFITSIYSSTLFSNFSCIVPLHFENEAGQRKLLFFGVDSNATDGYDEGVEFSVLDTIITEDWDLPPAGGNMDCRILRDTLDDPFIYSYAEIRGIPQNLATFKHRFIIEITGDVTTTTPYIDVSGDKLSSNIDSAKIRCFHGDDDDLGINMKNQSSIRLDKSGYRALFIDVGYNKLSGIKQHNHSDDYVIIDNRIILKNNDYTQYVIYDLLGSIASNGNISSNTVTSADRDLQIDIQNLITGIYSIILEKSNGETRNFSFIKK